MMIDNEMLYKIIKYYGPISLDMVDDINWYMERIVIIETLEYCGHVD